MQKENEQQNSVQINGEAMFDLYEGRIIILIENSRDEGGGFSQLILDGDQFKEVSNAIMNCFPREKDENNPDIDWVEMSIDTTKRIDSIVFDGMASSS